MLFFRAKKDQKPATYLRPIYSQMAKFLMSCKILKLVTYFSCKCEHDYDQLLKSVLKKHFVRFFGRNQFSRNKPFLKLHSC